MEGAMFRKGKLSLLITFTLLASFIFSVQGQQDEYRLNVHRNFGYSSGSQIRGSFNLDIVGPTGTIKSVTYLADGQIMSQVDTAPFSLSFQTSSYSVGWHDLSAIVETTDGKKITTGSRRYEFATAQQESSTMLSILVPLLGGVLLVFVFVIGSQMLFQKNKPTHSLPLGAPRSYGLTGGGVCPHCHRPFSLHWWSINAGLRTKFDRCDFCSKWSLIRRLSPAELAAAETAELQMIPAGPTIVSKTEDEKMKEMIDNSRYMEQ
jgi:hypothetical protein